MSDYLKNAIVGSEHAVATAIPQTQKADADQVPNSGGGYTFTTAGLEQLRRFLIIGTEGGTFYAGERDLTKQNLDNIVAKIREDGMAVAQEVHNISVTGRAIRQNPTLLVWALCFKYGDLQTRSWVTERTPEVCRTGTMYFQFVNYLASMKSFNRKERAALASFYTSRSATDIAYQAAKYPSRVGYNHRRTVNLSHPKVSAEAQDVLDTICGSKTPEELEEAIGPNALTGSARTHKAGSPAEVAQLIEDYRLSWEMIPTEMLGNPEIWDKLVPNSGYQALLRNLNRLTINGWLKPTGSNKNWLVQRLTDPQFIAKSRIHPFSIYLAAKQYGLGHGLKGSQVWTPITAILDALDEAFTLSYGNVIPTNLRHLIALDVSGSMWLESMGKTNIAGVVAGEAAAVASLITLRTEPDVMIIAFSNADQKQTTTWSNMRTGQLDSVVPVQLSRKATLSQVTTESQRLSNFMSGTDCALPFTWALAKGYEFDAFTLYTDNETNSRSKHPHVALREYRNKTGINARSLVCAMSSTGFSIADPKDPGMMDAVGLDAALPQMARSFFLGEL